MRKGDSIHGYSVLTEPTTVDGGQCCWAFVQRGDKQYFMKQFLWPKYPTPGSPGSKETRQKKLRECQDFERHHREIMDALSGVAAKSGEGGNLIVAKDWFLHGTSYFKVTEKVDVASLTLSAIAARPEAEKLLLLVTVSHSLQILHKKLIVHGDLKPENILVKITDAGGLTTKLIDFDNAFFSGRPPENPEELVGTMSHYSPEVYEYLTGRRSSPEITVASDIFALGLIFTQYLTGRLPALPDGVKFACVAAADGHVLEAPDDIAVPGLRRLVARMVSAEPEARPSISDVFEEVRRLRHGGRHVLGLRRGAKGLDEAKDSTDGTVSAPVIKGLSKFVSGKEPKDPEKPATAGDDPGAAVIDPGRKPSVVIKGLEKFRKRE